jgi:hypothetical protein
MTTGVIFGLIVVAHIWRAINEGPGIAKNPLFVFLTLLAVLLCAWAWRLIAKLPRA